MYNISKIVVIVVIFLLVGSSTIGGYYWYKLDTTRKQLTNTKVQLDNTLVELDNTQVELYDTQGELIETHVQLSATETQLDNTLGELDNTQVELYDTQGELVDTQGELVDTQGELVETHVQLSTTEIQLVTTEAQLDTTTIQLETAKNDNSKMINQYDSLKRQVNVRGGNTPKDMQSFITPSNSLVSTKVVEVTNGYSGTTNDYWKDCKRLYEWVVKNISYHFDSSIPILPETITGELKWKQEYWRMPENTLEDGAGDCEDMAALLASMLLSYNDGEYAIWMMGIRSEKLDHGHIAVAFPVQDGRLTILDPAGNYYTGQYGPVNSSNVSNAINNWLSHWQKAMPDAEVTTVFSEDIFEEFSSTAEFITWAQE